MQKGGEAALPRYKITKVYILDAESADEAIRLWDHEPIEQSEQLQFECLKLVPAKKRGWQAELKAHLNHKH